MCVSWAEKVSPRLRNSKHGRRDVGSGPTGGAASPKGTHAGTAGRSVVESALMSKILVGPKRELLLWSLFYLFFSLFNNVSLWPPQRVLPNSLNCFTGGGTGESHRGALHL